jgi:hypothetical protein
VIVIVGRPGWRSADPPGPAGRASSVALAAAARGARVELVGRVGEDPAGEALLIALAHAGVGHAAVLRDPTRPTQIVPPPPARFPGDEDAPSPLAEPEPIPAAGSDADASAAARLEGPDVDLAIKYIEPSGVMVITDDVPAEALAAAVSAAAYAQLGLVVLVAPGGRAARSEPTGLPDDATVIAAPDGGADGDGAFEALVAAYAAELDAGTVAAQAFTAAQVATGWEAAATE